ncbi:MAG: alanine--tRNA ligase [Coriobacteriales bacterium]|nr:alanine--tRNA ligase [Coriobacteriales bacterium]
MNSSELREKFQAFFEAKGCRRVPSSSLVPDDPSLLLTSAGMVQFKPYFLQQKQLEKPFIGATSVQKCVRTTDIDIIGTTGRHLSFFEMLGNFSFGAYFKKEMCAWAYEFSTEVLGFDPERLHFTVYLDDDETVEIWKSLGVPDSHITRLGAEDNFWMAGATGPCGPCSELYYDQGPEFGCGSPDCAPGCDCDRFLEYWNCVFTQYDRQEDATLVPLPKRNIDTGMGLERTAAILQGVQSNYETDILRGLIAVAERLSGKSYGNRFGDDARPAAVGVASVASPVPAQATVASADAAPASFAPRAVFADSTVAAATSTARDDLSMRIVADHARAVTFMIGDGILPSNERRGYVLRRLLRRAMRHGQLLGIEPPFLGHFVQAVIAEMGPVYPELAENRALIERIVATEEERFAQTLRQGQSYLDQHLVTVARTQAEKGVGEECAGSSQAQLPGAVAFELHDRFGFPIDLTVEIAAERGVEVDREGFDQQMADQRSRARAHAKDDAWQSFQDVYSNLLSDFGPTHFHGYTQYSLHAKVLAIVSEGESVARASDGQLVQVFLDRTPFYAEMGGQVGDSGLLTVNNGNDLPTGGEGSLTVSDTQIVAGALYAHNGRIDGTLAVGDEVLAQIDTVRRERIQRNHTATHLLHHALRVVLGDHVKQAGSLVASDHLRFDFTHFSALTREQLTAIEQLANNLIMEDSVVSSYQTSLDAARAEGVTALFGEKYGEQVRVLQAGEHSRELCGGTHVEHTAQIGLVKITAESSVGANIRRIEAVTSFDALEYLNRVEAQLLAAAESLQCAPAEVPERAAQLKNRAAEQESELRALRAKTLGAGAEELLAAAQDRGYRYVVARQDGLDVQGLRTLWDKLRERAAADPVAPAPTAPPQAATTGSAASAATGADKGLAAVLASITEQGAPLLLAAATPEAVAAGFDAGAVIKRIAPAIKGGGGGKAAMAQAGGKDASGLDDALEAARKR